jgi:hypothetical protein
MTQGTGFSDQYALANPDGMFDATIGRGADGWEDSSTGQRIDYILMNDDSALDVERARRVFTEKDLGRVSDHVDIYAEFEGAYPPPNSVTEVTVSSRRPVRLGYERSHSITANPE